MLAILAGLLNVVAFGIYNYHQTFTGDAHPSLTSWAVWGFITILNFTTYKEMSKDWIKSLLPTVSSIQCVLTFFLILFQGQQWKGLGWDDTVVLMIGIAAGVLWRIAKSPVIEHPWWRSHSTTIANLMIQLGITIGFVPTFQSVWTSPENEIALCWFIWSASFAVNTIVVMLRWQGKKRDLVYNVNCLWLHFAVGLLAVRNV